VSQPRSDPDAAAGWPNIDLLTIDSPCDWPRIRRDKLEQTLDLAIGHVPAPLLALGDRLALAWLKANDNPWRATIEAIGREIGRPGVALMNLCYEWGCTTATGRSTAGPALVRTVDWPLVGIGRYVTVTVERTQHGPVAFVTWPGFVGAASAFAPGRFALAVNQAPLPRISGSPGLDWFLAVTGRFLSGGLPLVHLVREAALHACNFEEAVDLIVSCRRVVAAGIVVACGTRRGETAVIERFLRRSTIHRDGDDDLCAANDWLSSGIRCWPRAPGRTQEDRAADCRRRVDALRRSFPGRPEDFSWVTPPVLNDNTRAALFCCPADGRLAVRGFDRHADGTLGPVTALIQADIAAPAGIVWSEVSA
jgi:hypothetical protein